MIKRHAKIKMADIRYITLIGINSFLAMINDNNIFFYVFLSLAIISLLAFGIHTYNLTKTK